MKGKSGIDIGIFIIKLVSACVFLGSLFYAIYYIYTDAVPLYEPDSVYVLNEWVYYDQLDVPQQLYTPCVLDVTGRDTFVFETTLPSAIEEGSVLAFLNLSDIDISIDGQPFYSWRQETVPIWGGSAKNSYFLIDLPPSYSGSKIKITRYGTLNKKFVDVFVGPKDAVARTLIVKNDLFGFALSLFLLVLSAFVIIGSFFLRKLYHKKVYLTTIAVGIFVASSWLFVDSFIFEFLFNTKYIDGLMSYVITTSILFSFMYYMDDVQEHRFHVAYFVLGLFELFNQIFFITLHLTGIQNLALSLVALDILVLLGVVALLIITVIDLIKCKAGNYRICMHGFVLFMISAVLEIVLVNVTPERVQGGAILFGLYLLLGFAIAQEFVDIRKMQHEKDLASANAGARTQFLANISHEIRTPINSILGMNKMIIKETDDSKIESYANIVNESGELLLSLINNILDFSKIDSGKHEIVNTVYNPRKIISNICRAMSSAATDKNINWIYTISENMPEMLYGDSKSLSQILINLLSNAVKYTNVGGVCLTAECEITDKCILTIKVTDTGIGIKREDLKMIFDPFSRTDLEKNQSIQGTGLGLAITKQLIEEMGGSINIDSEYGIGSTFIVTLPQDIPTKEQIQTAQNAPTVLSSDEDKLDAINPSYQAPDAKVLVVDDNNTNLIVVKAFLKDTKLQLDLSTSGKEAFQKCCNQKYDLILMDHMMPECDGIEAMHLIKEKSESLNSSTPIIILTANASKDSEIGYIQEGFDNYLSKPVDSDKLIKMVRMYLADNLVMDNEEN